MDEKELNEAIAKGVAKALAEREKTAGQKKKARGKRPIRNTAMGCASVFLALGLLGICVSSFDEGLESRSRQRARELVAAKESTQPPAQEQTTVPAPPAPEPKAEPVTVAQEPRPDPVTNAGYVGCLTEELFGEWLTAKSAKDSRATAFLLKEGCIVMREGLPVSVLETTWTGKVRIRVYTEDGEVVLWTYREAVLGL